MPVSKLRRRLRLQRWKPEGEEAATAALNVSVASGAVATPTGAAVVATEPVKDEGDSLPHFSEEEKKWRGDGARPINSN